MSTKQFGRWQRAVAIVPLALLSAAWTANLAGAGVTACDHRRVPAGGPAPPTAPTVPDEAIEAPASVSTGDGLGLGVAGDTQQIIASSSTNGIPAAALAAYQRAESVINSADESCNLTWQLIAAIGRVESNHGRFGGNALDDNGVAQPGIYGIALDGSNNTSVIRDTDAAQFDNDPVYDRAVGPMQFIPSTWSVVGVDADGDGQRNPQDIDDAALATAVYLCSGDDDLVHARPASGPRSTATTTRRPTSTWCSPSWTPTSTATSPRSPTTPPPPACWCPSRPTSQQRQQRPGTQGTPQATDGGDPVDPGRHRRAGRRRRDRRTPATARPTSRTTACPPSCRPSRRCRAPAYPRSTTC